MIEADAQAAVGPFEQPIRLARAGHRQGQGGGSAHRAADFGLLSGLQVDRGTTAAGDDVALQPQAVGGAQADLAAAAGGQHLADLTAIAGQLDLMQAAGDQAAG